jgi:hypothetical protein
MGRLGEGARPMNGSTTTASLVRVLLVLITILLGIIIGQVGGILAAVNGSNVAAAFVTGGVTFAGTTTLVLVIFKSLGMLEA